MLDNNKEYLPNSFVIPDYLCSVNEQIVGFTVPKIDGVNLTTILDKSNNDYKEQIYFLKKIGDILNQLHNIRKYTELKDIYINDLHDSNFIIDNRNRELKVIDLDSCKIGNNMPFASRFLTSASIINGIEKYKLNKDINSKAHIIPDSNTELYCYCITILNYLYGCRIESIGSIGIEKYFEYLNYLEAIGINKELIEIFSKLVSNCRNENPLNYLDSLTQTQILRSREFVYKKTKNNIL